MKRALLWFGFCLSLYILGPMARASGPDRKVVVSGECNLEVDPDRGSVVLVAEHQALDAKTAIRKATDLHEKLREQLKKSKLKSLELSSNEYTVQEVTEWENNKSVSKGFVCRIGVRAETTDISALGEILSIASDAGIKKTNSLQTFLSEGKALDEKKKCLEIAAKNARDKADRLARSLGAKLGGVIQIVEKGASTPQPAPLFHEAMVARSASMPAPTIEGGKQNLHHEVEVSFSLEY